MKWISKFILYNLLGFKIINKFPEELKKYIVIVAPHTSSLDFLIGLLLREIAGIKINYIGKAELFKPPFGWFFRWTGGAPVQRDKNTNRVEAIAKIFKERAEFRLALAPEGTRKKVAKWKTGFYYIAKIVGIPIVMVSFDFLKKEITISEPYYLTADMNTDFETIKSFYKGKLGKVKKRT